MCIYQFVDVWNGAGVIEADKRDQHKECIGGWWKDEPGHWLESVFWVFFRTSALSIWWAEGFLACKKSVPLIPKVLFQNTWRMNTKGGLA